MSRDINGYSEAEEVESRYQELETLVERAERHGVHSLPPAHLVRLGRLYRRASAELSRLRTIGFDRATEERLNRLITRAYGQIYSAPRRHGGGFWFFLTTTFPATYRRFLPFCIGAFLIVIAGAVPGWFLTVHDPEMPDVLFGPGAADAFHEMTERYVGIRNWMPEPERPLMSSLIMTNNVKVSILAFAGGMTFGLLTFYSLWFNGLMLGTVAAVIHARAVDSGFWGFVAPHGVIELNAIFIAGGAGLLLAWAMIRPEPYTRLAALKHAGRHAVILVGGAALMLIPAGLIEAFFSPVTEISPPVKLLVAALIGTIEFTYLFFSGARREIPADADETMSANISEVRIRSLRDTQPVT